MLNTCTYGSQSHCFWWMNHLQPTIKYTYRQKKSTFNQCLLFSACLNVQTVQRFSLCFCFILQQQNCDDNALKIVEPIVHYLLCIDFAFLMAMKTNAWAILNWACFFVEFFSASSSRHMVRYVEMLNLKFIPLCFES